MSAGDFSGAPYILADGIIHKLKKTDKIISRSGETI